MRLIERFNSPWFVGPVLIVFLLVDGFLLYRYQQSLGAATNQTITSMESSAVEQSTNSTEKQTIEVSEATVPEEMMVGETVPSSPTTTAAADSMRVGVRVVGDASWIQVQEDGRIVLQRAIQPGFSREFEADREISIRATDAGSVRTELDGQDNGLLGARGEDVIRTYTLGE